MLIRVDCSSTNYSTQKPPTPTFALTSPFNRYCLTLSQFVYRIHDHRLLSF